MTEFSAQDRRLGMDAAIPRRDFLNGVLLGGAELDNALRGGLANAAGPWAIAEFLDYPSGARFIQSFKSVAANPAFEQANLFEKRLKFEDLGQIFWLNGSRAINS